MRGPSNLAGLLSTKMQTGRVGESWGKSWVGLSGNLHSPSRAYPGNGRITSGSGSRLRALIHVEVLAALLVGERSPGFSPRDLEEIVDVESPDPDTVAPARGGELHSVRTESHTLYRASGPSQAELWRARVRVEQPHQTVDARYGDARSVGAEGEVLDASGRSGQHGQPLTALHIPYLRESLRTRQHDPRTGGIEVHLRRWSLRVDREDDLPPRPLPHPHALRGAGPLGRGHQVTVRAERDVGEVEAEAEHPQHSDYPAGAIDHLRGSVPACCGQIIAIRAEGDLVDVEVVSDPPKLLAGRGIPRPYRRRTPEIAGVAPAAQGDRRTVGAHIERLEPEIVGRRPECSKLPPRLQVPDRYRASTLAILQAAIPTARHHAPSVRHELRRGKARRWKVRPLG